ncbi:hypothetical protein BFV94_4309 [Alteromonas macleodii]|uniref:Uncharacterized protein n=2 Tax=Alteromonas macleodii TaxID=28108 RepID=A0AB36FNV4_ALTMA|nr:hypothetical protein BFV93_4697 [Alteromonas macleodii]OES25783.1 hypothetical protein BFV94_4309 [Alteromonas macleodii]OES25864.1 hypothetical protein BFV95_4252 [Alteromonas macleodii]OES38965.1 hypothetical protein BFV96_4459 [Alteromonas macleodii]
MHVDGSTFFVANRNLMVSPSGTPMGDTTDSVCDFTRQLVLSCGAYCCLEGQFENPFALLLWLEQTNKTLASGRHYLRCTDSLLGFTDVTGHIENGKTQFHYRFYNQEVFGQWRELAKAYDPLETRVLADA